MMDIDQYLQRIGFTDPLIADLPTLEKLQQHHLFSIPFEDLDIYFKIPIAFNVASFFEKVVLNRRGGYCYELNGLFHELLVACGFTTYFISCRVAGTKEYGPEFDHLALVVELDGKKLLVDVGYGDFALKPLIIERDLVQNDGRNNYIITDNVVLDGKKYMSIGKWNDMRKQFVPEYIFTLTPYMMEDFADMNHDQQINPKSHFVRTLMCSIPTEAGRISIVNNRVIETVNGIKSVRHIKDDRQRLQLLKKYFDINLCFSSCS
jgi:N-hydroxyarylamine O-acetyltransferase